MGKQRGAFASNFTGRVGNVVGRKGYEGEYIVSSYQPSVTNPSTTAQVETRTKFKLLSQLAASIGTNNLQAFKGVAKTLRGGFFKANFNSIVEANGVANLTFDEFKVSPNSSLPTPEAFFSQEAALLSFTMGSEWNTYADYDGFLIYVNNSFLAPTQIFVRNIAASSITNNKFEITNIPALAGVSSDTIGVWMVGYVIDESNRSIYNDLITEGSGQQYSLSADLKSLMSTATYGTTRRVTPVNVEG